MDSIDIKSRKPRRTKGTPSFKYRNRFAAAVIATGVTIFGLFTFTPIYQEGNKLRLDTATDKLSKEVSKGELMPFGIPRTSDQIKETIREKKEISVDR